MGRFRSGSSMSLGVNKVLYCLGLFFTAVGVACLLYKPNDTMLQFEGYGLIIVSVFILREAFLSRKPPKD
jgi:hypothetical protein